jgi:hypothetical protein
MIQAMFRWQSGKQFELLIRVETMFLLSQFDVGGFKSFKIWKVALIENIIAECKGAALEKRIS